MPPIPRSEATLKKNGSHAVTPVFVWGRKRIGARLQPVAGGLLLPFKSFGDGKGEI